MATPKVERSNIGWALWLQWVLANTAGVVVGGLAAIMVIGLSEVVLPLSFGDPVGAQLGVVETIALFGLVTVDEVLLAGTIATLQWFVLLRQVSWARRWVLASTIGGVVGLALGELIAVAVMFFLFIPPSGLLAYSAIGGPPEVLYGAVVALVFGITTGIAQWFILRRHLAKSSWWVLASIVASMLGGMLLTVNFKMGMLTVPIVGALFDASTLLIMPMSGALFGAITGVALVWLLRHPAPNP